MTSIAFNVAPRHFDDALILNDVGTIFDSSTLKLSQMVLELTERSRVKNLSGMRDTVAVDTVGSITFGGPAGPLVSTTSRAAVRGRTA